MRRLIPLVLVWALTAHAAVVDFHELRWRPIGPYRGGRTKAAAGVPGRPGSFLVGVCNGGVWKTTDYGRTWQPIFDDQPTGSIGAIAISPAAPDTIYVGSGEGLQRPDLSTGDGIYKSTDGGKTWAHLGLRDGQQIPQIAVDPRDANRLFVAVLGHPYGPNEERGIYRSLDGGKTFEKVLYKDADTGGVDVVLDPSDSRVVYAVLWEARMAPWENGQWNGPGSGLYKSVDGGTTWKQLGKGLPTFEADGLGRIGITVAPSQPRRLFATVETKTGGWLYRSDDAGESWALITNDDRVVERASDFAEVKVHPKDPDTVFTASVVSWKSTDGGKTWKAFRGAPGGDDYHRLWIDPERPDVILIASDQGAVITVNGGQTWSSWYNQPTAQMYHVTADNAFPYRVCGGQQESGSACVSSRGGDGQINFRDWHPVGVEEYGYAAPDPLDPDIVYGGKISRYDRRTGQAVDITPHPEKGIEYRAIRTQPVLFAPTDPHTLYFTSNTVWKTTDGGQRWTRVSPDLTREKWEPPKNVGKYADQAKPRRRGVVYALAPSPLDGRTIWAGTDDGLIHVTRDGGKTWTDVTPPELGPWAKVSQLDAGHFDAGTVYAAVNSIRLDDQKPHIYATHDGGKTWTALTGGLPDGPVDTVREDPRKKGLLYAGTEQTVYYSADDGASWRSLRQNLPATSIRDLIVKDDDLVVATHGRGFWILDDVTPLRQLDALAGDAALLAPAQAWRVRFNNNTDTPLPPDEPASPNPPDGAIIDYWLRDPAQKLTLEILDGAGKVVRTYASTDVAPPVEDEDNTPKIWIRPVEVPAVTAGLHRFVWDLRGATPAALRFAFPIAAVPGRTPREPRGPIALPGKYTVRLTVDGKKLEAPLVVKMDPRVKAPAAGLEAQHALAVRLADAMQRDTEGLKRAETLRIAAAQRGDAVAVMALLGLAGAGGRDGEGPRGPPAPTLVGANGRLARLYGQVLEADVAPTPALTAAADEALADLDALLAKLAAFK